MCLLNVECMAMLANKFFYSVSVLGREEGYMVKYTPLPEGVPDGRAQANARRQRGIFDSISRVKP